MSSRLVLLIAALVSLSLAAPAFGQAGVPGYGAHSDNPNGPTVSPYLNLLQSNSQGLSTYQTMVKPQIDQQNAIQRQGASLSRLQQQVNSGGGRAGGGPGTGHPTFFMNYSHYFSRSFGQTR